MPREEVDVLMRLVVEEVGRMIVEEEVFSAGIEGQQGVHQLL